MKKRVLRTLTLALSCVMLLGLFGCGNSDSGQGDSDSSQTGSDSTTVYEWDMLVENSLTHPSSILAQEFADMLEERSDGRIIVTVRAPGELPYSAVESTEHDGEQRKYPEEHF